MYLCVFGPKFKFIRAVVPVPKQLQPEVWLHTRIRYRNQESYLVLIVPEGIELLHHGLQTPNYHFKLQIIIYYLCKTPVPSHVRSRQTTLQINAFRYYLWIIFTARGVPKARDSFIEKEQKVIGFCLRISWFLEEKLQLFTNFS